VAIRYGTFINAIIAFVIIAFVVWRISKMFIKEEPAAAIPPGKTCPYCKEANAVDASKCRACASSI
jgi:large-conductance mechanosensitive channel